MAARRQSKKRRLWHAAAIGRQAKGEDEGAGKDTRIHGNEQGPVAVDVDALAAFGSLEKNKLRR